MSAEIIERKKLADGRTRITASIDQGTFLAHVKETVGFLQELCENDPILALSVAQAVLESLKEMFNVSGEGVISENMPQ